MRDGLVPGHGTPRGELRVDGFRIVEASHRPGLCIPGHAHDAAKIVILLAGGASERSGDDVLSAVPGEPVFRRAEVAHANQYHAAGACALLVELPGDDRRVRAAHDGLAGDRAAAGRLAHELVAAFQAPAAERVRRARAIVRALLATFAAPTATAPGWLIAARAELAAHAVAPPRLGELAARLGVHPVYLAQAFRARWGVTTRAFIRAHRVFDALALIDRGSPLAAAATAVGFSDQSHMTRAIRAARGAAPGELRRANLARR